jgi:membrane associated rhomboid family serine protease
VFLGFWFCFQLWPRRYSVVHPDAGGDIAFSAHVGGFGFGMLTVKFLVVRPPVRPSFR